MPKISQLPTLTDITTGSIIPVVDNSTTQKISVGKLYEFLSGALDQTFTTEVELMRSASSITSSIEALSSSFNTTTASLNTYTSSNDGKWNTLGDQTGSFATTGSNVFSGTQTISDSLIVSEIVSTTAPAEGDIASAGETGITYLTGDLAKWAIFREDAFTIGVWTDVVAGWAVTDNNGFTDIIAGRGSFGAASFQTTTNNWPAPASGRTYVFTSPDYQSESANPLEITIGNNDWVFETDGGLTFPDETTQTTAFIPTTFVTTSSFNELTASLSGVISSSAQITAFGFISSSQTINTSSFATTGSNTFIGNQTITGSLVLTGSLTSSRVLTDVVRFNTSAGVSVGVGELAWNNSDGTLDLGMKGGNVVQQIGQEIFYEVRNDTGIQIPNGTAVFASGVTAGSGRITAAPYTADGSIREVRFLGLATENISTGVNGFVTHFGYVRGLDTRGDVVSSIAVGDETWAVGDILYVHPTVAGKLTNVKPEHAITVAIIITRHQSVGVVFVRPSSGGHLEDIHDILINTGSLTNGQVLSYNSASGLWENANQINTSSFAITGSNTFNGNQTINGSIILENGAVIKDTPNYGVSFGYQAGLTNQGTQSLALGNGAGYDNQSHGTVAVGTNAGAINQGLRAVALGSLAATNNQGEYAIAIGNFAAPNNQASHSIVISATGTGLENTTPNSLVIAPIRNVTGSSGVLQYNDVTKEVSYSDSIVGSITASNGIISSSAQITAFGFVSSSQTINTSSLATTGSNTFVGNQTISGSIQLRDSIKATSDLPIIISSSATIGALTFDGTNYLTLSPGIVVGSGAYTAETFVYISDYSGVRYVVLAASTPGGSGFSFGILSTNQIFVDRDGVSSNTYAFASTFPLNQWFHIAITKNGAGQETAFVNGVKSTSSYGSNVNYSGTTEAIGRFNESVWLMSGSLSQIRLVVGSNVYDPTVSTINVPTTTLTNVSNTQLLLNVATAETYLDDTSGNQTVTNNNSVSFNSNGPLTTQSNVEFTFGQNGTLVFPDETIQSTAFTGLNQGIVSSSQQILDYGIFATTGSNTFVGNQTISGSVDMLGDNITLHQNGDFISTIELEGETYSATLAADGLSFIEASNDSFSFGPDGEGGSIASQGQRFRISTNGYNNWDFDIDGILSVPGDINGANNLATTGSNTFVGNQTISGSLMTSGSISATTFVGSGNQLTGIATKITGSWTVPTGASTRSFTVDWNHSYQMWVMGNIPNGIISWNANVNVTNANVPIVGAQYGWYYVDGNALVLTSIPDQIVGVNGVISSASFATTTSNTFEFGITNNSGETQTINYGYIKIS
jgi:hypothetical protein